MPELPSWLPPDEARLRELADVMKRLASRHPSGTVRTFAGVALTHIRQQLDDSAREAAPAGPDFVAARWLTGPGGPDRGTVHRAGCWADPGGVFKSRGIEADEVRRLLATGLWDECPACCPGTER